MAQVTFDRFDGGLLLARPSSTAPANSLSRALNVDPQPGGWMRARASFRRTPNATQISSQFKGLESNSGNLWTFGAGDAAQVTGATINASQATGAGSLFYAFHTLGTQNPSTVELAGYTKWSDGFVASFTGFDPISSVAYEYGSISFSSPKNIVYFDGFYLTHNNGNEIYKSSDGVNFTLAGTIETNRTIRRMNTYVQSGVQYLYIEMSVPASLDRRLFSVSTIASIFTTPTLLYSNTALVNYHLIYSSGGSSVISASLGMYVAGVQRTTGHFLYCAEKSGVLCAVGIAGLIKTSSDGGLTWTTRTSGVGYDLERVITHAGLFIAAGGTGGSIITSPDGVTWTTRTPTGVNAIASSGSLVWAGGQNGAAWKSSDGITWTVQNTTLIDDFKDAVYGPQGICAIGFDTAFSANAALVRFGGFLKVRYSRSGTSGVTSTQITDINMPNSGLMVTASNRIFAISNDGQNVRYCALAAPTNWTTADAGFLPVAQHFGSGQRAYGLGLYQSKLAVFTDTSIQIWKLDPDPTAIALENVIEGVGTRHHSSIVSLQGDLLFLSDSGVRSLTTLQNALYPTDTDVGLPIKKITPSPSQLVRISRFGQAPSCIGLAAIPFAQYWVAAPDLWDLDPSSGVRYGWASWSYSRQAKLNAWSAHSAAAKISAWTTLGSTVFARSDGDNYLLQMQPEVFGVEQAGAESAPYTAEMDTQWLDLKKPGVRKVLTGMDFDGQNVSSVQVYASVGGNREGVLMDTIDVNSNQAGWTYSGEIIPVEADGTEFKLRFVGVAGADVQINKLTLYYDEVGTA